jgi:predicted RNA-binding Zn ribbon-like protein
MELTGSLRLRHPDGQIFTFEPGSLSVAFVITGAPDHDAWFETLVEPEDLARWASDVLGATGVVASAKDITEARRLRAAIWHAIVAVVEGEAPRQVDRLLLNELAAWEPLTPRLTRSGARSWSRQARGRHLLSTVAQDAIDLVGGPRATRLKLCQGLNCAIPFVDTSRPGNRRWCSMERCGNRAKARTHYHRTREEVSQ